MACYNISQIVWIFTISWYLTKGRNYVSFIMVSGSVLVFVTLTLCSYCTHLVFFLCFGFFFFRFLLFSGGGGGGLRVYFSAYCIGNT